ncbi:ALKBH8 [Acanthosepion pharaonis]|uniref:ALKBH8 n=1 Tax=Acanthosepion pharaonis TaxID=158019 RepID=A0A812D1M9_ACAPH|nr:ALKBH8 [Sepia pharaonis]
MAAPIVVNAAYSVDKKIIKKLNRCRHTLRKLDNIDISEEATNILCVFNGGLDTGVCREELEQIFSQDASIENIIMLPKRPYSFVYYLQVEEAVQVCNKLNGARLSNGSHLYISYVKQVPVCSYPSGDFPPGLILKKDLISENYEKQLLELANWDYQDLKAENTLKHRRVKHFGYEFKYGINNVDPDNPLPERIPKECDAILLQLQRLGLISHYPDQLTINQYLPGQGIPPHIDTPSAFEDGIVSVSLGSQVVMDFQHPDGRHRSVPSFFLLLFLFSYSLFLIHFLSFSFILSIFPLIFSFFPTDSFFSPFPFTHSFFSFLFFFHLFFYSFTFLIHSFFSFLFYPSIFFFSSSLFVLFFLLFPFTFIIFCTY